MPTRLLVGLVLLTLGCSKDTNEEMAIPDLQFEIQEIHTETAVFDKCYLVGDLPIGQDISPKKAFIHLVTPPVIGRSEKTNRYIVGVIGDSLLDTDEFAVKAVKQVGETVVFDVEVTRPESIDSEDWDAIAFYKVRVPGGVSLISIQFSVVNDDMVPLKVKDRSISVRRN